MKKKDGLFFSVLTNVKAGEHVSEGNKPQFKRLSPGGLRGKGQEGKTNRDALLQARPQQRWLSPSEGVKKKDYGSSMWGTRQCRNLIG